MPRMRDEHAVAVISGAGSGIGREVALELARRGWDLGLLGRRLEPLQRTLDDAGADRAQSVALACDVRDAQAVARAVAAIESRWGAADVVVPAAGVSAIRPLEDTSPAEFAAVVDTN